VTKHALFTGYSLEETASAFVIAMVLL